MFLGIKTSLQRFLKSAFKCHTNTFLALVWLSVAMSKSSYDWMKQYLVAKEVGGVDFIVKELIVMNRQLRREMAFYKDIEFQLTQKNLWGDYAIVRSDVPQPFIYREEFTYKFITLTFDPTRFDQLDASSEESQKLYILNSLYLIKWDIKEMYGCFEKHKSGIIHSHLIMSARDFERWDDMKTLLNKSFSSRHYNEHAVDVQRIKDKENVLEYINAGYEKKRFGIKERILKEKFGFYYHKTDIGEGLDEYNPSTLEI